MTQELKVAVKKESNYAVLRTDGYINNPGGEKIARECYKLMEDGYKHFVFDFSKSKVINSIGISILIEIIEKVLEIDGSLNFTGLTTTIAKTFKIMGLTQYAHVYDSLSDAATAIDSRTE
ncbi:MAG TPA: STAS domain-containing protein [Acidobacteriota bacterium]|nr:STAS domain-containing protein [Acidobacteriota bacterium]